jgi:hypothetical protein
LRGVAARGCRAVLLLAAYFFRILLPTELQTDLKPFREMFPQATTAFQRLQRYEFLNSLHLFFMILLKIFKAFAINNLSTLPLWIFPPHLSSLKGFKSIELDQTTQPIASQNELFYSTSSRIPFVQIQQEHQKNTQLHHNSLTESEFYIMYI